MEDHETQTQESNRQNSSVRYGRGNYPEATEREVAVQNTQPEHGALQDTDSCSPHVILLQRDTIAPRGSMLCLLQEFFFYYSTTREGFLSQQPGTARSTFLWRQYTGKTLDESNRVREELRRERKVVWKRNTKSTTMLRSSGNVQGPVKGAELWEQ